MAKYAAPNYRPAPGSDRCDRCFFRAEDGTGCSRFELGEDYRPSFLCNDYSERSMAQRYESDGPQVNPHEADEPEVAVLAADDAAETFDQFATINGVEIFRVGTWNGKKYTSANIDQIVAAAAVQGYRPPVKLGHTEEPGAPAYGYAVNLRRDGDSLLADFENVPEDLVSQIRDKRYDAVSSEIYFDLKRDKATLPLALRAVAVLGAHPPAVGSMKPLSDSLAGLSENATFTAVTFTVAPDEEEPEPEPEPQEVETPPIQSPTPKHPLPPFQHHQQEIDPMTVKNAPGSVPANETPPEANTNVEATQTEMLALQAQVAALRVEAATAQAAAQAASTSQLTIQRLQEQVAHSANALKMIAETRRQERINALVESVVRPAWRNHIRALADLGTRGDQDDSDPQTVIFQAQGADEATPTPALAVMEDLVRLLNADVAHLFVEQVKRGDIPRQLGNGVDDPSAQLFTLIGEYCRTHPGTDPDVARRAVLTDPKHADIVRRWNNVAALSN